MKRDYEDDSIRLYTPVLQRIIILVAVIIAVPVVMWTITTFIRSYVAPPRVPTFQPMAIAPQSDSIAASTNPAPAAPASQPAQAPTPAPQATPQATADAGTTTPPNNAPPPQVAANPPAAAPQVAIAARPTIAPPAPSAAQAMTDTPMSAPPVPAPTTASAAPSNATPDAADKGDKTGAPPASDHPFAWPTLANNTASAAAGPDQTPTGDSAADSLPASDPITGRIPLPRHRPNVFAMVEFAAVPLPRARPALATDTAPSTEDIPANRYDPGLPHY